MKVGWLRQTTCVPVYLLCGERIHQHNRIPYLYVVQVNEATCISSCLTNYFFWNSRLLLGLKFSSLRANGGPPAKASFDPWSCARSNPAHSKFLESYDTSNHVIQRACSVIVHFESLLVPSTDFNIFWELTVVLLQVLYSYNVVVLVISTPAGVTCFYSPVCQASGQIFTSFKSFWFKKLMFRSQFLESRHCLTDITFS